MSSLGLPVRIHRHIPPQEAAWKRNQLQNGGAGTGLAYPATPADRDEGSEWRVTGQIPDSVAAHTASDVPVSAFGIGALQFVDVQDNTDVFFKLARAAFGGY